MIVNRREFLAALAAGYVVTAEGLWLPGKKVISIPKREVVQPDYLRIILEGEGNPLPVGVNGKILMIPYGEVVNVPKEFVRVLDDAMQFDLDNRAGPLLVHPYRLAA